MVTTAEQFPRRKSNASGGNGLIDIQELASKSEMYHYSRLFAHITIRPGDSIGTHTHAGETEFYYILKGNPTFDDNGTMVEMKPGDMGITGDNESHGLINDTDENVEIISLILLTPQET